MYISEKEHARSRYMERAIERMLEISALSQDDFPAVVLAFDRILSPFRIAREKRHAAHKETQCHANKSTEG